MTQTTEETPPKPRRRGRWRRRLAALLTVVAVLVIGLGVAVAWLGPGREMDAPDWLRDGVSSRLDAAVPGAGIDFGSMRVGLRPKGGLVVALRDVALRGRGGLPLAEFRYVEADLNPSALLTGRAGVQHIALSGIALMVRRDTDGRLALAFEEAAAAGARAPSVLEILAGIDRALMQPHLAELRQVDVDAVTLRYEDYRAERAWTVDGGRVALTREGTDLTLRGDFALLTGGSGVATVALSAQSEVGSPELSLALAVTDVPSQEIATQAAALAWLGALRAPISGAFRGAVAADGTLGTVNASLQIGAGAVQPTPGIAPVPFQSARSYFAFDPDSQTLRFDELSVDGSFGGASLTGSMTLEGVAGARPTGMMGQITVTRLELASQELFSNAMDVARAEIDLHLALDPFVLRLGRIWVDDPDLPVHASGRLAAEPEGWSVAIEGQVPEVRPEAIAAYWPPELRPGTRRWLVNRVETARVRDAQFALRIVPGQPLRTYADFEVHDAVVHYADNLPALYGARGHVTIDNRRLVAELSAGHMTPDGLGRVEVGGSRLTVEDIGQRPSQGRFDLVGTGDIAPILAILDRPPMRAMSRAGLPVELGTGQARVEGWLEMPFKRGLRGPDFAWDMQAELTSVATDRLIPDRRLESTRLTARSTRGEVSVRGTARLDGVPMTGTWRQPLGQPGAPGVVLAQVPVGPAAAARLGIPLPDGMFSGEATGALRVEIGGGEGPPRFSLTSDLEGLAARVDPLAFRFGRAQRGQLDISGRFTTPPTIDDISVQAGALSASGDLSLRAGGGLERLDFTRFSMGSWLRGRAALVGRGTGPPGISLTGGTVDFRAAPDGLGDAAGGSGDGTGGGLGPITLELREFRVTDSIALTNATGNFTASGALRGAFRAQLNGGPMVQGQAVPTQHGTALILQTENAGNVLMAAGVVRNARDGEMEIRMQPQRSGGYVGTLTARDLRLRDTPAFAELLDAISIVGLLDQLEGPGIIFNNVQARFRLTEDRLVLEQSSATGPSMGVSLDGYYHPNSGQLDLQGVLSPLYALNGIGQIFSRRGEGLVGFNFNIRGTANQPRVTVNPLSLFTPGMFRDIFRRPPPTASN